MPVITQPLRKVNDAYIITIPQEEVDRQQLTEGQLLKIDIQPAEENPVTPEEVHEAFELSWKNHEDAYRYLADH